MATSTAAVLPRRAGISRAAIVGWSIVAGYVVLGVASLALERAHVGRPGFLELWLSVAVLAYAVIGALVLSSQPRHVIGWMFCIAALSFGLAFFAGEYAVQALVVAPGTLPFGYAAAWFGLWAQLPAIAVVGLFLPLLFPDGHLPSPRWRPAAFGAGAVVCLAVLTTMFAPTTYANAGYPSIRNPFGLDAYADVFNVADMVLEPLLLVVVGFGAAALVFRLRTANGVRRQQLKWFAYGAALMTLSFLVSSLAKILPVLAPVNEPLAVLALTALPVAVGTAILRHRLYDIDLIINKTIVYALLTAVLAGVYTGAVAFFQRLFVATTGQGSDIAIVATLFVLATVFTPIKNRLQESVDHRVKPKRGPGARSAIDDLVSLAELHGRGILTDEEFAATKKRILGI